MVEVEKQFHGIREPKKAFIAPTVPASKFNTNGRDLEANIPPTQSVMGPQYGMNRDQSVHPPVHTKSFGSLRSAGNGGLGSRSAAGGDHDQASVAEELAWGPSHPCFPHLNPHVPFNSPEYVETRIIRIRRDWMVRGDLAPTFSNLYPEILDPLLPEQQFRAIIQHLNMTLVQAFDPYSARNWLDGLLGLLTGWLWEDIGASGIKGKLKKLEKWIVDWNQQVGAVEGVAIIPLRRTGYMSLDIQIPDPHVRVVGDDETTSPGGTAPNSVSGKAIDTAP